jgi:uncharacterized protein
MQPFSLLMKPSGSDCNLDCTYCFYRGRSPEIGRGRQRMSEAVLDRCIKDYLELRLPLSSFCWQGGEPTLMGLDFYKKVIELQRRYGRPGQQVSNALQTNGILLDDEWCRFLRENKFLVGLSIDGPKELHDHYRRDLGGNGSFDRVVRAIQRCQSHEVEINTLTLVSDVAGERPEEVFDFLIDLGIRYMQFIPCVEIDPQTGRIAAFSVDPQAYGQFLCRLFDRWMAFGPTRLGLRPFDSLLGYCVEGRHSICTFARQCNQYVVVEHTGDVFPCDFFVEPRWRLGNLVDTPIDQLAVGTDKRRFARSKEELSNRCLICRYLALCRGGCLKHRLGCLGDGTSDADYFCQSYKAFFDYAVPRLMQLGAEMRLGHPTRSKETGQTR